MKNTAMSESVIKAMEILYSKYESLSRYSSIKIKEMEVIDYALDYFVRNPKKEGNPDSLVYFAMKKARSEIYRRSKQWVETKEMDLTDSQEFNTHLITDDEFQCKVIEFNDFLNTSCINEGEKEILRLLSSEYNADSISHIINQNVKNTRVKISRIRKKLSYSCKGVA